MCNFLCNWDLPQQEPEPKSPEYTLELMHSRNIRVYQCEHGCLTTTSIVDFGHIPILIKCMSRNSKYLGKDGECIGLSRMLPASKRQLSSEEPSFKWVAAKDVSGLSVYEIARINQGGLVLERVS